MVNNIKNDTISEISAKKGLNKLNEIKNAEIIKYKKCTPKQNELLNLFNDLLDVILTDKTLKSKSQKYKTLMSLKDENKNKNENGKTLMSSNNDDYGENENENDKAIIIKQSNGFLDKIIDKSKSFEEPIESIKKVLFYQRLWR